MEEKIILYRVGLPMDNSSNGWFPSLEEAVCFQKEFFQMFMNPGCFDDSDDACEIPEQYIQLDTNIYHIIISEGEFQRYFEVNGSGYHLKHGAPFQVNCKLVPRALLSRVEMGLG